MEVDGLQKKRLSPRTIKQQEYWSDIGNQRKRLEELGKSLGVKELDDWYSVPRRQLHSKAPFLWEHHKSFYSALKAIYPDHNWDYYKFHYARSDFNSQKQKLEEIGRQLHVNQLSDWYNVPKREVYKQAPFIQRYYKTLSTALKTFYPHYPWSFPEEDARRNKSVEYQREKLKEFEQQLGIKHLDDWYSVSRKTVHEKLPFVGTHFKGLYNTLKNVYPEHNWDFNRFRRYHWFSFENQMKRIKEMEVELNIKHLDEWYFVPKEVIHFKAPFIRRAYKNIYTALKKFYPEHPWDYNRFTNSVQQDIQKHKEMLEALAPEFKVKTLDDWYKVSQKALKVKAPFIRKRYDHIYNALKTFYPAHPWSLERFSIPHWRDFNNQKKRFEEIGKELGVTRLDDWYNVPRKAVYNKAPFVKAYYKNVFTALKSFYPEHPWSEFKFSRVPSGLWQNSDEKMKELLTEIASKHRINTPADLLKLHGPEILLLKKFAVSRFKSLNLMIQTLLPVMMWKANHISKSEIVLQNVLKRVTKVESQAVIGGHSIDIFLPQWKIAVEYQGNHHYQQTHHGYITQQLERDKRKRQHLRQLGIHLVQVGYWWDGSWSHLRATLQRSTGITLPKQIPST